MEPTPEQIAALRRLSDALNEVRTAMKPSDDILSTPEQAAALREFSRAIAEIFARTSDDACSADADRATREAWEKLQGFREIGND